MGSIISFQSAASADLIYFADVARRILELLGKPADDKGIFTVDQLPAAIARLEAAIESDKEEHRRLARQEDRPLEAAEGGASRPAVSLTQRALPLLEMLKLARQEKTPVVWGM